MKNKVFLGGTCNNSTWREEIIPYLTIDYFNPVVEDWTEKCIEIEEDEKENKCNIHLYVITSAMTGVYSIAEMIASSYNMNKETIIQIVPKGFTKEQFKSLRAATALANKQGALIIEDDSFSSLILELNYFKEDTQLYLELNED